MATLSDLPINTFRPATDPTVLQLYSFATPNGIKVSAMLEEIGLPYEAHAINIMKNDQMDPAFIDISPNNKIPAIADPNGPDGKLHTVFETGAILIYLAEKTGKLLSQDPAEKSETLQWLMWQMGGLGPMLGQFGHFYKFAADKTSDAYAVTRYTEEAKRLLGVLNTRLEGRQFIVGDSYSIADVAIWPWLGAIGFYGGNEVLGMDSLTNVTRYLDEMAARPASIRAPQIPARD